MTPYILHVAILIGISYLFYRLFLKKETFFRSNRWLLLAFLPVSFLLPFMEVPAEWSVREATVVESSSAEKIASLQSAEAGGINPRHRNNGIKFNTDTELNAAALTEMDTGFNSNNKVTEIKKTESNFSIISWFENISWELVLKYVYLFGVTIFFIRFLVHLFTLLFKTSTNQFVKDGIYKIYHLDQDIAPCSFGNCIFINPKKYDRPTYDQILKHEKIHVSMWHSIDIILTEILIAAQWFNPFAWLYRKAVENNLEYLTDQLMLNKGTDRQTYQMSLLKVSVPHSAPQLVTNYNHSFLKKRIIMMNAKKSPVRSGWKYLLVLPIIGLSIICLNSVQSIASEQVAHVEPSVIQFDSELDKQSEIVEKNKEKEKKEDELKNKDKKKEKNKPKDKDKTKDKKKEKFGAIFLLEGKWEAEIEGNEICLSFRTENDYGNHWWGSHNCIDKSEFSNLSTNGQSEFKLTNDAGTITFVGSFNNGKGEGTYSFEENKSFRDYLSKEGINNVREETLFHACINKTDKNYIASVKQMGFSINKDEFKSLSHFGTSLDEIKNYNKELKRIGYEGFTLNDIAHLDVHHVSIDYINEMHQLGFKNLTIKKMVQASIHNVTPEYFRKLKAAGLEEVKFDDLISFAIHNVEPEYVKEMQNLSSRKLSNEDIVQASIHHVTPEYFDELKQAGMEDMSFDELIQFSIHNISPSYVKEMQNLSSRKLTSKEIIQAGIHNVSADYFEELKAAGMGDMELKELIQFSIHNVSPQFVAGIKKLGYDNLSNEEVIQASIHGVSTRYISSLQEAGIKDAPIRKLIEARIHGVDAAFIKKVNAGTGENTKSLDYYIEKKIRGWNRRGAH